ncbi:ATR-interacting protein isoform X1 [Eptesicus fuscus]|uniref:ATR-interacting protein isoform X1 n=1 Tax=Eptesicus fuscus TaxID=29078 RepID=UPI002403D67F|nr:ATR-interacting protein isoform X1 [Eptesicus fuscus]
MAGAPAPGGRRRGGSLAPGLGPAPSSGQPPSKRARGLPSAAAPDPEDPFGLHGDFTADDLEELDILASQALSQCPPAARGASSVHGAPRSDGMSRGPAGRSRESAAVKDNFELELLQAQYKELKEKMKAMEEEVLIKNGEIKILRDSLHQTESVLEEQRRSQFLLEQEKAQALSDREREFCRKLQSLQSELQFKDAEMNELRTKLQCSERAHRPAVPSTSHGSPRKSPSVALKPEACSPRFGKPPFPTKESFSANTSFPQPCPTEPGFTSLAGREENKTHSLGGDPTKQEESQKSLVGSLMRRSNTRGSILINLLLKQPLIPGSPLGLCHLLSCGSEAPTSTLLQPLGLGSAGAAVSGLRTTGSRDGPFPLSALREAQSLALTGLNLVAREEDSCDGAPAEGGPGASPLCQLPGAVHLLPLVQFFVGAHCQALQDSAAARRSGTPGGSPSRSSCGGSGAEASAEDSLCSLESCCVASLGVLQHLVCHSGAVVRRLLSGAGAGSAAGEGSQSPRPPGEATSAAGGLAGDQGRHPLLETLLRLLAFSSAATGHPQASLLGPCLTVLVTSAENSPRELLPRFQCVFPLLPRCLRPDVALPSVLLAVKLLALLADHETLAPQLCSRSEGCLLLLLYTYVTSRPDRAATDTQWLHLEQEAVWLLAKLGVQSPSSPVTGSSCQCNVEVVRALTAVLHRQWLTVRRAGRAPRTARQRRTVRCLRDAALLLHSLSQKDKRFAVHCVGALHQYDQAVPGVSALIRSLPDVTDCEEAALDDLCAAEPDADDPDVDCG